MKDVVENVRVLVASDPAQRVELERAAGNVRKKRCRLECSNVQRDTYFPQLLLENRSQQASALFSGSLHGEMKPNSIDWRIAGRIEQLTGAWRIEVIGRDVGIRPTLWRKKVARGPGGIAR